MKKIMKRIGALSLALTLAFVSLPTTALADNAGGTATESGSDPIDTGGGTVGDNNTKQLGDGENPAGGDTNPPEDNTNPPEDNTNPPEDNTNPPEDNTNPPEDNTNPPVDNTNPPEGNTNPPGGNTNQSENEQAKLGLCEHHTSHDETCTSPCTNVCQLCNDTQEAYAISITGFATLSEEVQVQNFNVGMVTEEQLTLPETLDATDENGSVTIEGVTWACTKPTEGFDGNISGQYIYTATLPEEYTLANDEVKAPEITVNVRMLGIAPASYIALGEYEAVGGSVENTINTDLAGSPTADVKKLTITGTVTDDDFTFIKGKLSGLEELDLSGADNTILPDKALSNSSVGDDGAKGNLNNLSKVTLPDGMNEVGGYAFYECVKLTSVNLSQVKTVGISAFAGCSSLETVNLAVVETLEDLAFVGCKELKNVYIPQLVTVNQNTFTGCVTLKSVKLPKVTTVGDGAFRDCEELEHVDIPQATKLGESAFDACSSLTIVEGASLITLGEYAFNGCTSLTTVDISQVNKIGGLAFQNCTSLTTVDISHVKKIDYRAFENCTSLTTVDISQVTEEVGYLAFLNCTTLKAIALPEVDPGFNSSFSGCSKLILLVSGGGTYDNLERFPLDSACASMVGENSLLEGEELTLTVTPDMTAMGDMVTYQWSNKKGKLTNETSRELKITEAMADDSGTYKCEIKIGGITGTVEKTVTVRGYEVEGGTVKQDIDKILGNSGDYTEVKKLTITSKTMTDDDFTFIKNHLTELVELDLSGADNTILPDRALDNGEYGNGAKGNLDKLTTVILPDCMNEVGKNAFYECGKLTSVNLSQVKTVGDSAFCACLSLETVDLTMVENLGEGAFSGCKELAKVDIPQLVTVNKYTFRGCEKLKSVKLPKVKTVGDYAFCECEELKRVDIPQATTLGESAFMGCSSLKTVDFTMVEKIDHRAFENCSSLTKVDIPKATKLGAYAFNGCTSLTTVDISQVTEEVGYLAFLNCTTLKAIALPAVDPGFNSSFSGCSKLILLVSGGGTYEDLSDFPSGSSCAAMDGKDNLRVGETLTLTVTPDMTAMGDMVTYKWYKDKSELAGETSRILERTITTNDFGTYECIITVGNITGMVNKLVVQDSGKKPSGGSGKQSTGSSGQATPTKPTVKAEHKTSVPTSTTVSITGKTDANGQLTATITEQMALDAIEKALAEAKRTGRTDMGITLHYDIQGTAATSAVITIEDKAVDRIKETGVWNLHLDTPLFRFSFDAEAVKELDQQTAGLITVTCKPLTNLSDSAKALIGNRPAYAFSVSSQVEGKTSYVEDFKKGTLMLAVPYQPTAMEKTGGLYTVCMDENGKTQQLLNSSYREGWMLWNRNNLSAYGVGYKAPTPPLVDTVSHWAKDDIDFVVTRGFISSLSSGVFAPEITISRTTFLRSLDQVTGAKASSDLIQNVDGAISRQDMAVMLAAYTKAIGYIPPTSRIAVTYADAGSISPYAKDAVKAMQQAGLMCGRSNNTFDPRSMVTKAEASAILRRLVELSIDTATAKGWSQNDSGQYQYIDTTGKALTGWQSIGNQWYYFNSYGELAVNTSIDGYQVGADGARQ